MATVRQYAAWAEKRIAGTVTAEGVSAGLLAVRQGPLTLTFALRVLPGQVQPGSQRKALSMAASLRKVLSLGPALAQALQVEAVRVTEGMGCVLLEVPLPAPARRTPTAEELAASTRGLRVAVGYNASRKAVQVDLAQHGALLWVGPSRRGKTQSLKSSLYGLARANSARRLLYVVLSQKAADWRAFEPAAGCMGVVSDTAEAARVLAWAVGELHQRATGGHTEPAMLIVADDLLNILSAEPGLAEHLAEIASMGAGLGVHLWAGTQTAGSKQSSGGAALEANVTARIVYKPATAAHAARATGFDAAGLDQLTSAKGDALLIDNGEQQRIATGLADDRQILQLQAGSVAVAPWHPATGLQRVERAYNGHNGPVDTLTGSLPAGNVGTGQGGAGGPVAAVATVEGYEVSTRLAEQVAALFPLARRAPEPGEAALIAGLAEAGMSLSALCKAVYGHKDGKAWAWVKSAAEGTQKGTMGAERHEGAEPGEIDLSTPEGAAVWRAMQRQGLVRLPDTSKLVQ